MITRRELVTGSALGAIATATAAAGTAAATLDTPPLDAPQEIDNNALRRIADQTAQVASSLNGGFRSNTLAYGFIPKLREAYTLYWKTNGKFPEFCEIGIDVFYDLYDWHIKNALPIPVSRTADGRMVITFMYTQLIVRVDQIPGYIGVPFDRQ
jgi:hypothetical protein